MYIGGREGDKIWYRPPLDELENAVMPNTCRTENRTYGLECIADIETEYQLADGSKEVVKFEKVPIANLPLMLMSKYCHLTALTPKQGYEQGEDLHELGGYFIVDGGERTRQMFDGKEGTPILGHNLVKVRQERREQKTQNHAVLAGPGGWIVDRAGR